MARNIEKTISDYEKIGYSRDLILSDIGKIRDLSIDEDTGRVDAFDLIVNAFKVGYVVGYRRAKRQ